MDEPRQSSPVRTVNIKKLMEKDGKGFLIWTCGTYFCEITLAFFVLLPEIVAHGCV